jgi:hypothetical protein
MSTALEHKPFCRIPPPDSVSRIMYKKRDKLRGVRLPEPDGGNGEAFWIERGV